MLFLVPAALPTNVDPYIATFAAGFAIGIAGHLVRSRILILTGILIVGGVAVIFGFAVAKIT